MKQVTVGELRDVFENFSDNTIIYIQRLRDKEINNIEVVLENGMEFIPALNIGKNKDKSELYLLWEKL